MSNIDHDRIAQLRRQRTAALGRAKRATDSAMLLRVKADQARDEAARCARQIEALGGTVKR